MKLGKLALAMMVSTTLVGCGGGGSDEAPKPDVKPPVTTPDPDTKPPVDPEEPDTDNPVLPPVDPEEPDTEEPEVTPPPVIPEKPIFVDGEKCKASFGPGTHDYSAFYCFANSKEDALNFTNIKVNMFHGVDGAESMRMCTEVVETPHNNEGLDGTPNAYYTTQSCYNGEIMTPKPDLDYQKCEEIGKDVPNGEVYYCGAKTLDSAYTAVAGFTSHNQCNEARSQENLFEHITSGCFDGKYRKPPVMTFGAAQALIKNTGNRNAETLPSCTANNEYLNVNIDPDFSINDCSPITDDEAYKVRLIMDLGSAKTVIVSSIRKQNEYDNNGHIVFDKYLINESGTKLMETTEQFIFNNMDVDKEIQSYINSQRSTIKSMVLPSNSLMNTTADIVYTEYTGGSEDIGGILTLTYIKPDLSVEKKAFTMPVGYSPEYDSIAVSDRLILTGSYQGLIRGFDPVTGKIVKLSIPASDLVGFNDADDMVSVSFEALDQNYGSFVVKSYNSHGELVAELDRNYNQYGDFYPTFSGLIVDGKITTSYDYPINVKEGIISNHQVCNTTDNVYPVNFGHSGAYAINGNLVCTGSNSASPAPSYVKMFLVRNLTGDIKNTQAKAVHFADGKEMKITGVVGNNLKAEDTFGSSYVIDSTNGNILGESHFDDLIINK
ncbi:hypothetical protein [Photobacterium damselae]|uniref:hypothetical protein n=1 Tax=Photobacterium damselae TaxID=38293 RepID=UPI0013022F57|nr:hypothetical protein [Photobacterium damselae]